MNAKQFLALLSVLTIGCATDYDAPAGYGPTQVRLVNVGHDSLDSLVTHVTGRSYPVGTLAPGDPTTVEVESLAETHVELEHANRAERLLLDVYFEQGYGGRVRAEVSADSIVSLKHDMGRGY